MTSLLLLTRRASAKPVYGEAKRVVLLVPDGWRRMTNTEVTALPELIDQAKMFRSYPGFASLPFAASDGKMYAIWVEQHYHEPGGPIKPWGYHHGVTLLAKA